MALQTRNSLKFTSSDDHLSDSARDGINVQKFINGQLSRFGLGGLAYMQCSSVATTECCGNATLIAQRGAQAFPARIVSLLLELMPDELDKLVCQHDDDDAGCCLGLIK